MSTVAVIGHVPEWDMADRMRKTLRESGERVQDCAGYFGVSRNTVGTWINGRVTPDLTTQRLWAMRYGVPLEWLQTGFERGTTPGGTELLPHLDSNQKPFDYVVPLQLVA